MPLPSYVYRAQLIEVIDGDTVDLFVDQGLHNWHKDRFRLAGLQAPEKSAPGGRDATEFVKKWFADHPNLVIVTEKDRREQDRQEKFGRWLAAVYSGDESLNGALLASGHAVQWDGKGVRPSGVV